MNKHRRVSFAKQLTYYLLSVLVLTFIFIVFALKNSSKLFIRNNAYLHSQTIATNVLSVFEKQVEQIEKIPKIITEFTPTISQENIYFLPGKVLRSFPSLIGCSLYFDSTITSLTPVQLIRQENGNLECVCPDSLYHLYDRQPTDVLRECPASGYWIYSKIRNEKTIALCYPLYRTDGKEYGILKMDFAIKTLTGFLRNYKLFDTGFLFIIDQQSKFLAYPDLKTQKKEIILTTNIPGDGILYENFMRGETGCSPIYYQDRKYYIYYTSIPLLDWELGIICPYEEINGAVDKFYIVLSICLFLGILFLIISMISIIHYFTRPMKLLAHKAIEFANGNFDTSLPISHSSKEIQELYEAFEYMRKSIVNSIQQIKISAAEKEQLNAEMRLAQNIQRNFLPKPIVFPENMDFGAKFYPCRQIGGDLYDYFMIGSRLYFIIGDVSGKGIPAALYMHSLYNLLHYIAKQDLSPAAICNIIHKAMTHVTDQMFTTLFIGSLDINTGIITYTNAGQCYPLIIHENGEISALSKHSAPPIGVVEDYVYKDYIYTLARNTSLVLYTDGVTEAENHQKQFYGLDRLIHCIKGVQEKTPERIIQAIIGNVQKFTRMWPSSDDLTILCLLYKNIPGYKKKFTWIRRDE